MRNAAEAIPADKRERCVEVVLPASEIRRARLGGSWKSKIPAKGFSLRSTAHLHSFFTTKHGHGVGSPSLIALLLSMGDATARRIGDAERCANTAVTYLNLNALLRQHSASASRFAALSVRHAE